MTFSVAYSSQAVKFLRKANKKLAGRIIEKIEALSNEPITSDTKKIHGSNSLFRVRVGDVRILYEIFYAEKQLGIARIDRRENAYERL